MNIAWFRRGSAPVLAAVLLLASSVSVSAQSALLDYNLDLVSTYVSRGVDYFTGVQDQDGAEHVAFNMAPAVQPALTLYGPGGLSFGLWGSFALTNRGEDEGSLKDLDEVDYTLAWDWANRLGAFTVGLSHYATVPQKLAPAVTSEVFVTWGPTFLEGLSPSVSHYSDLASSAAYTSFGIGGGEALTWAASLGLGTRGVQDVTASVGAGLGASMSVAFNLAYRPTPAAVGPYDSEGKYTTGKGEAADYPPAIFWLSLSYGGSVTE
ncbi:MAG: hypothetical protein HY342_12130 [Candidatus Lambdaproteobacteria bacterium]|nr:hypothetical protein [Candidatus Lambdaproteobacteria bacterium]